MADERDQRAHLAGQARYRDHEPGGLRPVGEDRQDVREAEEAPRTRGIPNRSGEGRGCDTSEPGRRHYRRRLEEGEGQRNRGRQVEARLEQRRSAMSVLIKGGRILTAADDYVGDVYVEGERISLIGESLDLQADKVIDAAGKYVLPGCVDPHTHLDMPFGGTVTIDDVESGQTAA